MRIVFTSAARHLQPYFSSFSQDIDTHTFSDGELYVGIPPQLAGQDVWVVANTIPPAENLIELFLILDALQRLNCTIYLFCTYFSYARQDRALSGESLSAHVISKFLQQFRLKAIHIIHVHSHALHEYLSFNNEIPYSFFAHCVQTLPIDILVAPDKGAHELVEKLSKQVHKSMAFLEKKHGALEETSMISLQGDVAGKNVLIMDDMISTAGTITTAAQLLKDHGAQEIYVAATHGIFSDDAVNKINASPIKHVFVTNTLNVAAKSPKISIIDIATVIYEIIFKNTYR